MVTPTVLTLVWYFVKRVVYYTVSTERRIEDLIFLELFWVRIVFASFWFLVRETRLVGLNVGVTI